MDTVEGVVNDIVFRNDRNGWTVMELVQNDELVTAVGVFPNIGAGETVSLCGEWVEHHEYGRQFKFASGSVKRPETCEGIEKYLASGLIKGIRAATARNIVRLFGEETLEILDAAPWRLAEVKGITAKRAQKIAASYQEVAGTRRTVMALQSYGMTITQAAKLCKQYGENCLAMLNQNPYRIAEDIDGIGFRTADGIAMNMGFERDSAFRIAAGIKCTLDWARTDGGHTCYPFELLTSTAARALDVEEELVKEQLDKLVVSSELTAKAIDGQDMAFLPGIYRLESENAGMLRHVLASSRQTPRARVEQELEALEHDRGVILDRAQRDAVLAAFDGGALVITGGPGTGKTTIIKFIILLMEQQGMKCELCAPTGRAAKRMSEATGRKARTIHRMLEYDGEYFRVDEDSPLEADIVIVDEMSMVDAWLFHALLCALDEGARLIMVGDADQLPSVGAGDVLHDIINSQRIPVARLTEIFRQARQSRIVTNAHRINEGELPLLDFTNDFGFEQSQSPEAALERVAGMLIRGRLGDPLTQVQVLVPMKKGTLGVKNINDRLQRALNPPDPSKAEQRRGDTLFREGDKVMQVKNDYQLEWTKPSPAGIEDGSGVFNGDMGKIVSIDQEGRTLEVLFDDERTAFYLFDQLEELELAYCISIHKSQGSEFETVILPLYSGPPMLMTRNLLYTAITRARTRAIIIGRRSAIEQMVANDVERTRYTAMGACLKALDVLYESGEEA